jgi:hypothetical protein
MDEQTLIAIAASLDGVEVGDGAFGPGVALWVGRREIAHFDGPNVLDLRLTREVIRVERESLKRDPRVTLRRSASDWLELDVTDRDVDAATALIARAVEANRASAPPGLPPTGADLERRRRFH